MNIAPYLDISHVASKGSLASAGISWFGAGFFSHVDIVVPDWYCDTHNLARGSLLGARSDVIMGIKAGVQIRPPAYEKWSARVVIRVPCTPEQAQKAFTWAARQIGCPYDKIGILAFLLGRNFREEGAWWCSELGLRMLEIGGIINTLPVPFFKITPGDCAIACGVLGQTVLSEGMPVFS